MSLERFFARDYRALLSQGTNGGVSSIGLASSLIGGLVIGVAYFLGILMSVSQVLMIIMRVVLILIQ